MKVSCIVPVYNEAKSVANVIQAIKGHKMIDEIIVINDGSTDTSEVVLKRIEGIKLISYSKNKGKTQALKKGLKVAKNEWIMTIDADLVGLSTKDIEALLHPIYDKQVDMTMTVRKNSLGVFKLFGLDFISGERVFRKTLLPNLDHLDALPKFGFEVFLNNLLIRQKGALFVVPWKEVVTPRKSTKFGFYAGFKADIIMLLELVSVLKWGGLIGQFLQMRRLIRVRA